MTDKNIQAHKPILVAIDGSAGSMEAFEYAVELIKDSKNPPPLILLHVTETQETSIFDPLHEPLDRLYNLEQKTQSKEIQHTYENLCKEHNIQNYLYQTVESHDSKVTLVEQTEKLSPKMLVMGSRGLGFMKRLVLGSVSSYVVQNAHCPVLVVKTKEERSQ